MSSKYKGTVLVIDGNWYLWRCAHATKTSREFGSVLIYNFLRLICKDALAVQATHLIVAFDGPKVFRYKLFPAYKANRSGGPKGKGQSTEDSSDEGDELHDVYQYYPRLFEVLAAVGISFYQPTKYEADDCLRSCADLYTAKGYKVVCGTQDKDAYQYVTEHALLYDSSAKGKDGKPKPRYIDEKFVVKSKGIKPKQMVEYQMLLGDSIDNVPGIAGIGPKTAAARLAEFGTIKQWYKNGSKKDRSLLRVNQAKLVLNKKMFTLVSDVVPPFMLSNAVVPKKVKLRKGMELPKSYYDYVSWLYPKSKGLAGFIK